MLRCDGRPLHVEAELDDVAVAPWMELPCSLPGHGGPEQPVPRTRYAVRASIRCSVTEPGSSSSSTCFTSRLEEVKTDCLAQGLAQFLHVSTGSETARQLKNFGPQLFDRLVVDAHGVYLFGHHS